MQAARHSSGAIASHRSARTGLRKPVTIKAPDRIAPGAFRAPLLTATGRGEIGPIAFGTRAAASVPDSPASTEGISIMRKNLTIALSLLALVGVAPLLGACHTTAGIGEDVSATGHAVTHSADKNTP
jgi:predicted small secreted protein